MMNFEDAIKLMSDANAPHVRIMDTRGKKIYEIVDNNNVQATIAKLNEYRNALQNMGRLTFIVADDKIKAANWQNAYHWDVLMMPQASHQQTNNNAPMHGYMTQREVELTNEVHRLKMERDFDMKLLALKGKEDDFKIKDIIDYLPLFMNIDPSKIAAMNAMRGLSGTQQQGLAGANTSTPNLTVQMSKEEAQTKLDTISANILKIINTEGIGIDKVEKLVAALADKPQMVDTALTFIN